MSTWYPPVVYPRLADLIPKSTMRQYQGGISIWREPRRRSPTWYLAWPTQTVGCGSPLNTVWTCWPELSYCSAPAWVRCECGSALHGHDLGDENG